jgi:hypothetical protein
MADPVINSTSIAQRPDVYIEPGTGPAMQPFRPPGFEDEFGTLTIDDDDVDNYGEAFVPPQGEGSEAGAGLQPPDVFTIISQTPRIATDGRTVMDVVVNIGDTLGATSFELRFI